MWYFSTELNRLKYYCTERTDEEKMLMMDVLQNYWWLKTNILLSPNMPKIPWFVPDRCDVRYEEIGRSLRQSARVMRPLLIRVVLVLRIPVKGPNSFSGFRGHKSASQHICSPSELVSSSATGRATHFQVFPSKNYPRTSKSGKL